MAQNSGKNRGPNKKEDRFKNLRAEQQEIQKFNSRFNKVQIEHMHKMHLAEIRLRELKYLGGPNLIIKRQSKTLQDLEDSLQNIGLTLQDYLLFCNKNFISLLEQQLDSYFRGRCVVWAAHLKEFLRRKNADSEDVFKTAPCKHMVVCCGPLCSLYRCSDSPKPRKK